MFCSIVNLVEVSPEVSWQVFTSFKLTILANGMNLYWLPIKPNPSLYSVAVHARLITLKSIPLQAP